MYNGNDASPAWAFVDGNGADGLNLDPTLSAFEPQLTSFASKLYAVWFEGAAGVVPFRVRVAVYGGNDASPSWQFVDSDVSGGLNVMGKYEMWPQLTVFDSRLYAIWSESFQARVAVYNGNDAAPAWTLVDGGAAYGINRDPTQHGQMPQLTAFGSRLYATWHEAEAGGTTYKIRVAAYGGNDAAPSWTFVDGDGPEGLNQDSGSDAAYPQLTVFASKLYTAWGEWSATLGRGGVRVAVASP